MSIGTFVAKVDVPPLSAVFRLMMTTVWAAVGLAMTTSRSLITLSSLPKMTTESPETAAWAKLALQVEGASASFFNSTGRGLTSETATASLLPEGLKATPAIRSSVRSSSSVAIICSKSLSVFSAIGEASSLQTPTWVSRFHLLGRYEPFCRSCGDSGNSGAPAVGLCVRSGPLRPATRSPWLSLSIFCTIRLHPPVRAYPLHAQVVPVMGTQLVLRDVVHRASTIVVGEIRLCEQEAAWL